MDWNGLTTLRGDVHAFIIIGTKGCMVYFMLEDGKLPLRDSKTAFGTRSVKVKKGDIICLYSNPQTGYEEFFGFDEKEETNSNVRFSGKIPAYFFEAIRYWCELNRERISIVKEEKFELPKNILEIGGKLGIHPKFKENIKKKLGIDINIEDFESS